MTDVQFVIGITNLRELAEQRGLVYESDGVEERVLDQAGTVLVRAYLKPERMRNPKPKDPTVWMKTTRPHTHNGHPQDVGDVYLAREDEVENIINLKFAVRDTPPKRATR